jgi:hypothetical protein
MKLKTFQRQDLARAALHDGLILSWDTGLGKTWATFLWPLLKVGYVTVTDATAIRMNADNPVRIQPKAPVLIIAPGDLHQQIADEALKHFKIKVVLLPDQATFTQLSRKPGSVMPNLSAEGKPILPPEFYLTSYTQLATNGVVNLPDPADWPDPVALLQFLCLPVGKHQATVSQGSTVTVKPDQPPQSVYGWDDRPSFTHVCQFFAWRGFRWATEYNLLGVHPDDALDDLERAFKNEIDALRYMRDPRVAAAQHAKLEEANEILCNLFTKLPCPKYEALSRRQQDFVLREFCSVKIDEYSVNNGCFKPQPPKESPWVCTPEPQPTDAETKPEPTPPRIKCLYSPSLADLSYNAFDAVVIDEGVKMKGEETLIGKGVRAMEPKYRLILTATPVKNRLPDIFRLAWWSSGGKPDAHARWPYADDSAERGKFAETFMVSERNLTKEKAAEAAYAAGVGPAPRPSRYTKLTAEVCNVHRLWKLLGPIVLRRRKQDAGEDIVPRVRKVIRCDLGTLQQQVYQYHLQADYRDKNGEKAVGAQLQALRMAAADPSSEHLQTVDGRNSRSCPQCKGKKENKECPHCHGEGSIPLPHRSGSAYIPKMATTLTLVQEILQRQEQVVIFSAFNDPLDNLGRWLDEAAVRYVKLDGRVSQKQRGKLAAQFKKGRATTRADGQPIPVMLAGVECMAEGHSFHLATNVILIAYSWAYDKFKQALDRVHRITSTKPVNVYVVLCSGTIDRKLESLIQDKGDAAELVLDGRLIGERTEEVNLAELLQVAQREFADEKTQTINEAELFSQWSATLREQLGQAMAEWDRTAGVPIGVAVTDAVTTERSEVRADPVDTPAVNAEPSYPPPPADASDWRTRMAERAKKLAAVRPGARRSERAAEMGV